MQQRQLRLGDILDDYCPRERRVTNHAVVAMVGNEVKQTRCTTCDADHEYKHAKVPRQRRKSDTPAALYAQVLAGGPKRVSHGPDALPAKDEGAEAPPSEVEEVTGVEGVEAVRAQSVEESEVEGVKEEAVEKAEGAEEEGPVHRRLIRATLPRQEGQPPPQRPAPEFTIRQPTRPNRFRQRHGHGPHQQQFHGGNRSGGNVPGGSMRGGMPRQGGGRPPMMSRNQRQKAKGRRQK